MIKYGKDKLVELTTGSPVMELVMEHSPGVYVCGWFDGERYVHACYTSKQLVAV